MHGEVAPGFEPVGRLFEEQLAGEVGAALCVYLRGAPVVDVWGGFRDAACSRAWQRDTIMPYSVSKAMVALAALVLVDRGLLGLDEPVARHWPEFATHGKGGITLRQVLSHQSGVIALDEALPAEAMLDWERITTALASARPRFTPGSAHAESARFYGHLVGEVIRRVDGRSLGAFFREEVATRFDIDFHIGLGRTELARCAEMVVSTPADGPGLGARLGPLAVEAHSNPPGMLDAAVINSDPFRRAEIPAINGHGSARGVARVYALLSDGGALDGQRLLSQAAVDAMLQVQRRDVDLVLGESVSWALGVRREENGGFGMGGRGGHLGAGHRALRLGFGYVKNRLGLEDRTSDLLSELVRCALRR